MVLTCQNLDKHQWKNRLLLIFSDDKSSELLKKQVETLSKERQGLQERKLKIYHFSNQSYIEDFSPNWKPSDIKTRKYFKEKENFKIVLIGLDGGIKLKQKEIISTQKLFTIIDGMPMRRAELNSKN